MPSWQESEADDDKTYLVLGVGGAAVIAVIGFVLLVWRGFAQNWRPEELKRGRVVMVEKKTCTWMGRFPWPGDLIRCIPLAEWLACPGREQEPGFPSRL